MGEYEDLMDRMYELHAESDESRRAALLDKTVTDDIDVSEVIRYQRS